MERDQFTLDNNAISSYRLGSCDDVDTRKLGDDPFAEENRNMPHHAAHGGSDEGAELWKELTKVW